MSSHPTFSDRLLAWWDKHGRKDLPWQHPRTPYRVWVSEIMLQQTQVTTVIPYFTRWMARFPAIADLAAAALDDVLALWAGLGYYARARNLHTAAHLCLQQHAGELPDTAQALVALPGIGLSTANAIISQASDVPAPVLDGNVRRVLARHAMIEGWAGATAVQKTLWDQASARLPRARGADYTQAIMDLGALVCTRSNPDCPQCPLASDCQALAAGAVDQYPAAKPKTRVQNRAIFMLLVRNEQGQILLERRPPAGIWGGLWCPPEAGSLDALAGKVGLALTETTHLKPREHRLTHLLLRIQPVLICRTQAQQVRCSAEQGWFAPGVALELGLPKPVADLMRELQIGHNHPGVGA